MLKGNQLKFQRGAAAKAEGEDRNNGGENRHHAATVRLARENLQSFSALWRFEQGQPKTNAYRALVDPRDWTCGFISRADVADFLVKQIEDDAFLRKTPVLTS